MSHNVKEVYDNNSYEDTELRDDPDSAPPDYDSLAIIHSKGKRGRH